MNLLTKNIRLIIPSHNTHQHLTVVLNSSRAFKCPNKKYPKGENNESPRINKNNEKPLVQANKKEEFKSMWETITCDPSLVVYPPSRFDALYYKPTDLVKRSYQQTWVECPCEIKSKDTEHLKDKILPRVHKSKKPRPDTAKSLATMKNADLLNCPQEKDGKQNKACLKIILPGCRKVSADTSSKIYSGRRNCKIPKFPYPSFSESKMPTIKPKRRSECEHLKMNSMTGPF